MQGGGIHHVWRCTNTVNSAGLDREKFQICISLRVMVAPGMETSQPMDTLCPPPRGHGHTGRGVTPDSPSSIALWQHQVRPQGSLGTWPVLVLPMEMALPGVPGCSFESRELGGSKDMGAGG